MLQVTDIQWRMIVPLSFTSSSIQINCTTWR